MFNKTGSTQYAQNRYVFNQFFEGLKDFYREYPIDINKLIKKLFVNITVLMFNLLDEIDETKAELSGHLNETCIEQHFDMIKPFGSTLPFEIETQLVRSLEAVKLFTIGITKIRDIIVELYSKFENPTDECMRTLTRMSTCSMCSPGFGNQVDDEIKPCMSYCLHVYAKCIEVDLNQMNPVWNSYLGKIKFK